MNPNSTPALDLYAKVEDMLGIQEASSTLYAHYLLALQEISPANVLDVGCGSGIFIDSIQAHFPETIFKGIDLSPAMVLKAKGLGVDAEHIDLCSVTDKYDVITATFDVLNYLDEPSLKRFLGCVKSQLNDGGCFLCDINTEYGFTDIAVGSFIADEDDRFLTIDSYYDDPIYSADFVLFERSGDLFQKSSQNIKQYFHTTSTIEELSGMKMIQTTPIKLFGEEPDKVFLKIQKDRN